MVKFLPSFMNRNKDGKNSSNEQNSVKAPFSSADIIANTTTQAADGSNNKSLTSINTNKSKSFNHSSSNNNDTSHHEEEEEIPLHLRRRYRGFSTSISALFLDEQVVCSAVACCGILASRRTEYLLEMRNTRRGVSSPRNIFSSSNIVAISFLFTILILLFTYLIWGSTNSSHLASSSSNTSNTRFLLFSNHGHDDALGFIQLRMYHRFIWYPIILHFIRDVPHDDVLYNSTSKRTLVVGSTSSIRSLSDTNHSNLPILLRVFIILFFIFILGIIGRQRRLHVRYDMIKTRLQEDQMMIQHASTTTMDRESALQALETDAQGACSHSLVGCYPVDIENNHPYDENIAEHCYSIISYLCCGCIFKRWIQCLSWCALAQEAREVRLLVPPKMQRIDLITNQPFDQYYKDIYSLRRGWKGLHRTTSTQGWNTHVRALSILSNGLVVGFSVGVTVVTLVMMFNPIFSFTWGDAFVILFTFGQSFLVLGIVHGIFHKSDLSLDAVIKFFSFGFFVATSAAVVLESIIINMFIVTYYVIYFISTIFGGGTWQSMGDGDNYFGFQLALAIFESYVVAALSEEFCKYYTFRTIEHPDLIFLTGLDRSKKDETAVSLGGNGAYPFSLENASALVNRKGSFEADYIQASKATKSYRGFNPIVRDLYKRKSPENDEVDDEPEVRTINQQAAAVTTALISTAVGLACAENFLYVFVLSHGTSTKEEIILLIFRSLFPVHALCAALQSTSIVRKFLENDERVSRRIGVGGIVFPAILLHGAFDLVIMTVNVCIETYPGYQKMINVIGGCSLIVLMVGATIWYYVLNRQQNLRLKAMRVEHDGLEVSIGYIPPLPHMT